MKNKMTAKRAIELITKGDTCDGICEFCTVECTRAEYDEAVAYAVNAIKAYEDGYKEAYQRGRSDAAAVIQEAVNLRKRY